MERQLILADARNQSWLSREAKAGRIVRIARGVYSPDVIAPAERQVREHLWELVAHFVPDAVVVDRSAASGGRLTPDGILFVASGSRARDVQLPGVRVAVRPGAALTADSIWPAGLRLSSRARVIVDNLTPSRSRAGRTSRTLSPAELEEWLVRLAQDLTSDRLHRLRDQAKQVTTELGWPERSERIDDLFGVLQGTRDMPTASRLLRLRATGQDWDVRRVSLFESLADALTSGEASSGVPSSLMVMEPARVRELPFFEAYFSNFIEGTEFTIDEAVEIVYGGRLGSRPADAHDVTGTYRLIADVEDAGRVTHNFDAFVEMLTYRHSRILEGRPDQQPGQFKQRANQAGSYTFVAPELVVGTLRRGFEILSGLTTPFDRAVFTMFLVAEVHPFDDGNGRVARLAMNAELTTADHYRIIVPTVYRNEYQTALRQMSRERRSALLTRTLGHAWQWTAQMDFSDLPTAIGWLNLTDARLDSTEAANTGKKLQLPADVLDRGSGVTH